MRRHVIPKTVWVTKCYRYIAIQYALKHRNRGIQSPSFELHSCLNSGRPEPPPSSPIAPSAKRQLCPKPKARGFSHHIQNHIQTGNTSYFCTTESGVTYYYIE